MDIPTNEEILKLLDGLETSTADDLESQVLDFKPWYDPKDDCRVAIEYAACMANADGGVIVFGVADRIRGRQQAIHGAKGYKLDSWRKVIFSETQPHISVEVEELEVPEGTGRLLVVRIPKGDPGKVYGTSQGLYKKRVGKNCMPMDPASFLKEQYTSAALDWSGEPVEGASRSDIDPLEIARARSVLKVRKPGSELINASDDELLNGLEAVRKGRITRAGLLLFGKEEVIADHIPQSVVHYVYQLTETGVARNDLWKSGLLKSLELLEQIFNSPINPEQELSEGMLKVRIPAFPVDMVREAMLNAVTHRDYTESGEVLVRHTKQELVITSPGGFPPGITPENILKHEPFARNRTLAYAFLKLGLVESSGVGRRRIFVPALSFGKRIPQYETDGYRVTLRMFDGTFDEKMAGLIAKRNRQQDREVDLDALLLLTYLKAHSYLDVAATTKLLQVPVNEAKAILEKWARPGTGILERKGKTKAASFHLAKSIASELLGKAAYTKTKGLNPIRYAEMVRTYVEDHGRITPQECRELLGLGETRAAMVEVSRLLKKLSSPGGILSKERKFPKYVYRYIGDVSKES